MKKYRAIKREELEIIYSDFIKEVIIPRLSASIVYPHNCSQPLTIMPPNKDNLDTISLKEADIVNFCDYNDGPHLNTFIKTCNKKNKREIKSLSMEEFIECTRNSTVDPYDLKELNALFTGYLAGRKHPDTQEIRYRKGYDLYRCLISEGRNYTLSSQECFDQYFRPIQNIPESSKPLTPSLNLNQIGNSSNEALSYMLISLITMTFCAISLFICKFANKFLQKNKDINETLPVNRLKNRKPRKSNTKAQSPCSKLENCIRSCEKNCKRGY